MNKLFTSDKIRIAAAVLLLAEMLVIFALSAQHGQDSLRLSNSVGSILGAEETVRNSRPDYNGPFGIGIRKYAHFSAYALLGMLAYIAGKSRSKRAYRLLIAVAFCAVYAVSDELHQYFVPERACTLKDMLIDTAGASAGGLIMLCIDAITGK